MKIIRNILITVMLIGIVTGGNICARRKISKHKN